MTDFERYIKECDLSLKDDVVITYDNVQALGKFIALLAIKRVMHYHGERGYQLYNGLIRDILYKKGANERIKLEDLAIAKVQDYMIDCEKKMVEQLVREKKLGPYSYLLKDGSLEYMQTGKDDPRALQKIKHNYNWVIGVSKSFNPETIRDHTNKPNANYIAELPVYHRTPVARYKNSYSGDVEFGVWYIRLRDKSKTLTPFDGVVKVEKILMDEEMKYGIDSDIVDLISANIINERNPTCYGTDKRWANHLYPVYLTETFVKSNYINATTFLHLF